MQGMSTPLRSRRAGAWLLAIAGALTLWLGCAGSSVKAAGPSDASNAAAAAAVRDARERAQESVQPRDERPPVDTYRPHRRLPDEQ